MERWVVSNCNSCCAVGQFSGATRPNLQEGSDGVGGGKRLCMRCWEKVNRGNDTGPRL